MDTDKPHLAAPDVRESGGSKMGWLRKLGGSTSSIRKPNRSPPREKERTNPPHAAAQSSSISPPASPDGKHSHSPAPPASSSHNFLGKHFHAPQLFSSTPDPNLVADLEELRKEVKGLQEAFVSLKREHKELRGELISHREISDKGASLPVDAVDGSHHPKKVPKGNGKGHDAGADMLHPGHGQNMQDYMRQISPPGMNDAGNEDDSGVGYFYEMFNCWGTSENKDKAKSTAESTYTQLGAGRRPSLGGAQGPMPERSSQQQPPLTLEQQQHRQQQQDLQHADAWRQPVPPLGIPGATGGHHGTPSMARAQLAERPMGAASGLADANNAPGNQKRQPPPRERMMDAERPHHGSRGRSESAGPVLSTAMSSDASTYTPGFGREGGRSPSPVPPQVRPLQLGALAGGAMGRHANDADTLESNDVGIASPWSSPRDVMRPTQGNGSAMGSQGLAMDQVTHQPLGMPGAASLGNLDRMLSGDSEEAPNFGARSGSSSAGAQARHQLAVGTQPGRARELGQEGSAFPWRAPQAGEPLVLPFPDLDDDGGMPPMAVPPPPGGMAQSLSSQHGTLAETEPLAGKLVFAGGPSLQSPRH